jgi:hypothetical protein
MKLLFLSNYHIFVFLAIFCLFSSFLHADELKDNTDSIDVDKPAVLSVELLTIEEIRKLPGKELQRRLKKKGVSCKGCSEKIDFINKVFESQEQEDIVEAPPKPPVVESGGLDKEKIDELMEDLRRAGYAKDGKVFPGSDFANLSPEEIQERMGRGKGGGYPKSSTSSKSAKKKATAAAEKAAAEKKKKSEQSDSDGFDDEDSSDSTSAKSSAKKTATNSKEKSAKSSSSSSSAKKPPVDTKSSSSSKPKTEKKTPKKTTEKKPEKKAEKKSPPPPPQDEEYEETIEL